MTNTNRNQLFNAAVTVAKAAARGYGWNENRIRSILAREFGGQGLNLAMVYNTAKEA